MGGKGSKNSQDEVKNSKDEKKNHDCIKPQKFQEKENVNSPNNISNNYPTLEEINLQTLKKFEDKSDECPICLENFSEKVIKKTILCGHCFCVVCIDQALAVHPFCPLCRKSIPKNSETHKLPSEEELSRIDHSDSVNNQANIIQRKRSEYINSNPNHWNIYTVRDIFQNHPNQSHHLNISLFQNDPLYYQAMQRMNDSDIKRKDLFSDPFFSKDHSSVFKNDPFFSKDHSEVFKNDPFFSKDHSDVFKNDPFFSKNNSDVFKNDPFFSKDNSSVFKNDPFFQNNGGHFSSSSFTNFFK